MAIKISSSLYNNNDDRFFAVTCKGLKKPAKKSNYTLRVSYDNLSKTIQNLHKQGATITNVTLISPLLSVKNKPNSLTTKSSLKTVKNSACLGTKKLFIASSFKKKIKIKDQKKKVISIIFSTEEKG